MNSPRLLGIDGTDENRPLTPIPESDRKRLRVGLAIPPGLLEMEEIDGFLSRISLSDSDINLLLGGLLIGEPPIPTSDKKRFRVGLFNPPGISDNDKLDGFRPISDAKRDLEGPLEIEDVDGFLAVARSPIADSDIKRTLDGLLILSRLFNRRREGLFESSRAFRMEDVDG